MFETRTIPAHLRMNIVVTDADGTVHDADADLAAIKRRLAATTRQAIAQAAPIDERRGMTTWEVGTLPAAVSAAESGIAVTGYPALLDDDTSVSLRVLTNAELQHRVMLGGVRRLLLLTAAPSVRDVVKGLTRTGRLAIAGSGIDLDELVADCSFDAVDHVLRQHELPWDADVFAELQRVVRREAPGVAAGAIVRAADVLAEAAAVRQRVARLGAPTLQPSVADVEAHLARLVRPRFVVVVGVTRLDDVARYVRAITFRLDRLAEDVGRDRRRMDEVLPLEDDYATLLRRGATGHAVVELGWRLEELRVSVFAQAVGAKGGVSPTKVRRELAALR